uniref:Uncharacterized protein n=1 Tax=Oryza nivara TaxID=4536 RepID=A0A0E0GJI7_ORYNI
MSPASSPTATRLPKRSTILLGILRNSQSLVVCQGSTHFRERHSCHRPGSMRSDGYAPGDDNVACRLMWRRTIR